MILFHQQEYFNTINSQINFQIEGLIYILVNRLPGYEAPLCTRTSAGVAMMKCGSHIYVEPAIQLIDFQVDIMLYQ